MKTTTIGAFSVATAVMSITVGYLAKVDQLLLPDEELALEDRLSFAPGGREEYLKVKQGQREAVWDEEKGWYNFGRFTQPPRDASLHWLNPFQEYVQLKEWYWSSFSSGSVLVAVATMQLGYTSHGIMYYYDVATGETDKLDVELKFFGRTLGPTFLQKDGRPSSPVNGSTEFSFGSTNITQAYQAETHMLRAEANGFLVGGRKLSVSFEMDLGTDDTLSFVYPLGRRRPVIVTKGGAFEARATVRVDEKELLTRESGLGMIDWTRSMAARLTTWNWAAFSFVDAATGDRVGVHLSAGVYEHSR
ncbi:hypothetical protein DIPPA_18000 [Diplonema papillatum]|nr:hypothetical protein DIPPA_18000 [Diplonema papillatum]